MVFAWFHYCVYAKWYKAEKGSFPAECMYRSKDLTPEDDHGCPDTSKLPTTIDIVKLAKELPKGDFGWFTGVSWAILTLAFFAKVQEALDTKFEGCTEHAASLKEFLPMVSLTSAGA